VLRIGWALIVALAGVPALAQSPSPGHPVATTVGNAAAGEALARRWCSSCHVVPGGAGGTDAAPPMMSIAMHEGGDPVHFRAFLTRPHGRMPPFQLARGEIADILAYFRMLAAGE